MATIAAVIRWADNTEQLRKNLSQGLDQIEAMTKSADKLARSFGGDKLIQAAHNYAAAIDKIGGAARLTGDEKARVNDLMERALAKYAALGQEAPAALRKLAAETQGAAEKTQGWGAQITHVLGLFGVAVSVAGVMRVVQGLMTLGDQLVRVSDQTGLTTEEVQRLDYVATQTGVTLEQTTAAIGQMQNRLASGDDSAVAAVQLLGLRLDDLFAMGPHDQFTTLAGAIAAVPDPATRAALAMDVFGRSGIALLPMLVSDIEALGAAAPVMADNTVRALDEAGDRWAGFTRRLQVWIAEAYNFAAKTFQALLGWVYRVSAGLLDAEATLLEWMAKIPGASRALDAMGVSASGLRGEAQRLRDVSTFLTTETVKVGAAATVTTGQLLKLLEEQERAREAAEAHAKALAGLRETMTGGAVIGGIQLLDEMWRKLSATERAEPAVLRNVLDAYGKLRSQVTDLSQLPRELEQLYQRQRLWQFQIAETVPVLEGLTTQTQDFEAALKGLTRDGLILVTAQFRHIITTVPELVESFEELPPAAEKTKTSLRGMAEEIGGVLEGTAGKVFDLGKLAVNAIKGMVAAFTRGDVLGAVVAGATAVIAGLGAAFKKIFGIGKEETKVNPVRQAFVDAAGGLDALGQSIVRATGSDALLRKLLDAEKVKEYEAAIRAITDAFDFERQSTEALDAAIQKYGISIEELGPKWRQQKLDELAGALLQDYELLIAAGVDNDVVLTKMGDAFSTLAQKSLATGAALPEHLRAPLERMIELGTLVDANGEKLTSLEGLTFAETLSQGFDRVVAAIERMVEVIARASGQVDGLATRVDRVPKRPPWADWPVGPPIPDESGYYGHHGGLVTTAGIARLHGGSSWVGSRLAADEVPAILQTGEMVLDRQRARRLGQAGFQALRQPSSSQGPAMAQAMAALDQRFARLQGYLERQLVRDLQVGLTAAMNFAR